MLRFLNTIRHGLFKTSPYYFSQPSHSISRALDKSHDFQTPFVFNTIKNISNTRGFSFPANKLFEFSSTFIGKVLKRHKLHEYHFSTHYTLLFYALALQIWFIRKNPINQNNSLKIAKILIWLHNWNIECLWRKNLKKVWKDIFENPLSCAKRKRTAKACVCRAPSTNARQTLCLCRAFSFSARQRLTSVKGHAGLLVRPLVNKDCRAPVWERMTNIFAMRQP
jgi:hypothetical protein